MLEIVPIKVTFISPELRKAAIPILVTLPGMIILVSLAQFSKAVYPMLNKPSGKIRLASPELRKAALSILVILSGMLMVARFAQFSKV